MINEIFIKISKTEDCRILDDEAIRKIDSIKNYKNVIQVNTEVSLQSGFKEVVLYVGIPDPPITLPKIFINNNSYENFKYLPHINRDLNICIFDDGINHIFNSSNFPEIVEEMIYRAKRIITQFDDPVFKLNEFEREFKAYWEISYEKNDIVRESGLSINTDSKLPYKGYSFFTPFNGFKYLIYQESELFDRFNNYLIYRKIQYKEIEVFEIDYNLNQPPYHLSFPESIHYIKNEDLKRFKQSVNKHGLDFVLVFFKNNLGEFYGWVYNQTIPPLIGMSRRHRRQITSMQIINGSDFSKSLVERIKFSELTPNRLNIRTSGYIIENKISVCLIGLGSLGSNLLNFLIKLPINKFHLIDFDILKLENIYRHQYGFEYITMNKAEIARWNILNKDPFCNVKISETSIVDILNTNINFLDEYEINIVAVGNSMLEIHILEHLIVSSCNRPLIIIWIEPFMASGQMLFISPGDFAKAKEAILNFPYCVLKDNQESKIYLKEGSCQTGFFPYSEANLTLYLSAIFPHLFKIIHENKYESSKVISWIGDLEFIKGKGLALSDFALQSESFQTLINDL